MKPQESIVFYHANCLDGFASAFAAWLSLKEDAIYVPVQYGENSFSNAVSKIPDALGIANRIVYVLDFSFPREDMECLIRNSKMLVWLDHHKTSFESWCKGAAYCATSTFIEDVEDSHHIQFRADRSGAILSWQYFHPDTSLPKVFALIDDYDRWQFKLDGTKAFTKAVWCDVPWTFDYFFGLSLKSDSELQKMVDGGNLILLAHTQNVHSVVNAATRPCKIGDPDYDNIELPYCEGLSANCPPHLTSDVGHCLANQSKSFGLMWYINKDGKCLCSLRSNGDYDVSKIAKAYGGGGHRNAAGFEVPIATLLNWIK